MFTIPVTSLEGNPLARVSFRRVPFGDTKTIPPVVPKTTEPSVPGAIEVISRVLVNSVTRGPKLGSVP